MKRLNPATNQLFKKGETREDGFVFFTYVKTQKLDNGFFKEKWLSPEAAERQWAAIKKAVNDWQVKRHKANRQFLNAYKLEKGCVRCGYKEFPEALDFDHIDPTQKAKELSRMPYSTKDSLLNEMAKCRVVCANCHRAHTNNSINLND